MRTRLLSSLNLLLAFTATATAQSNAPVIQAGGQSFSSWSSYTSSPAFQSLGLRCGAPEFDPLRFSTFMLAPSDCAYGSTTNLPQYDPGVTYTIPVVVHVIQRTNGQGFISENKVRSQIDILNEDFLAISGSNGAQGNNALIQFELATVDPNGQATSGVTYSTNNTWFNDGGNYWNSLAWDTDNYLNIYTNNASGNLGYVPDIPQGGGLVGTNADRVVVLWSSFGDNGPIGPPFNQGRTTTHEVGHYLGLYHTFDGGCQGGNCNTNGDLICDTNAESQPTNGCPGNKTSCGSSDPIHNYMDYSNDLCMWEFTPGQINRMRCTLENWRPNLADSGPIDPPTGDAVSLNIDIGANSTFPVPGNGYGAAAANSGTWNAVAGNAGNQSLLATDGTSSGISISVSGGNGSFEQNNTSTSGNAERILDDLADAGNSTWTLNGVADGTYDVYLYSWAPDDPTSFTSLLTVAGGAAGQQSCGGAGYSGSFVEGNHYVTDRVTVSNGTIRVEVAQSGGNPSSLNAIQVVVVDDGPGGTDVTPFCFGDGSGTACLCSNGSVGAGCANSQTNGAVLTASGNPEFANDTFGLSVSGIPGAKAGLCVKGSSLVNGGFGNLVGDGLLCTTPQLRSQVIVSTGAGNVNMNDWRSQTFSFSGAANFGASTYYQWWYRDPGFLCSGQGFNFSNALSVTWQ